MGVCGVSGSLLRPGVPVRRLNGHPLTVFHLRVFITIGIMPSGIHCDVELYFSAMWQGPHDQAERDAVRGRVSNPLLN
jgi:hypothetical protein